MEHQQVEFLTDKTRSRLTLTFKNLPLFLLVVAVFVMNGLTEMVDPDFTWETFKTPSYWYNTVLVSVSGLLMALATTLSRSNTIIEKDKHGKFKEANEALAKVSPHIQDNELDTFLYEVNLNRKKEAYMRKMLKKLQRIEKSFNGFELVEYVNFTKEHKFNKNVNEYEDKYDYYNDLYTFTIEALGKVDNKKVRKKVLHTLKMNEIFVDTNLDMLSVKYKMITKKLLTVGTKGKTNDDLPNSSVVVLANGLVPRFLFTLSLTTMLLSFSLDISQMSWLAIIPISIKVISLSMNCLYGYNFANSYVEQVPLDELYVKLSWLTKYSIWKQNKKNRGSN